MKTATVTIVGVAPYSPSRYHGTDKLEKEGHDDYEKRTWRNKCHEDKHGNVVIPAMAFKNCLAEAAQYAGEKIKGKGSATWTKHFQAGVIVPEPMTIEPKLKKDELEGEWLHLNADGKRDGGARVMRCFPYIHEWTGTVTYIIADETITKDKFEEYLTLAGQLIGVGRFRPRKCGYYGRFTWKDMRWE